MRSISRLGWGLVLIFLGGGFLLDSLGVINFHDFIGKFWPLILIIFSLVELYAGRWFMALIFAVLGIAFQLDRLDILHANAWSVLWPILLIIFGLRILMRPRHDWRPMTEEDKKEIVSVTGVFGGQDKKAESKDFKGASINSVFGGTKLDLRDIKLAEKGAIIDVSVIFGGAEILLPSAVPVKVDVLAMFGGCDDKRKAVKIEGEPKITIKGTIIFGGLEIKD